MTDIMTMYLKTNDAQFETHDNAYACMQPPSDCLLIHYVQ